VFRFGGLLTGLIKVGSENVGAVEVAAYLIQHSAIRLVSLVRAPHEKYGKVPIAFEQLSDGVDDQSPDTRREDDVVAIFVNKY